MRSTPRWTVGRAVSYGRRPGEPMDSEIVPTMTACEEG